MDIYLVNKASEPVQLKILFPSIRLAAGGIPAYGKIVYTDFDFAYSERTELLLVQSESGHALDTHLGLLGFLRECRYMSEAKLARFEAAGRERVLDASGRVAVPEGVFCRNPNVLDMYFYCSTLRVANKVFVHDGEEESYLLDLLESPLHRRLGEAGGSGAVVERVLRLMDSFYSSDVHFRAKGNGRGVRGFDRMAKVMNQFDLNSFRSFSLSGDAWEDESVFLTLFGE